MSASSTSLPSLRFEALDGCRGIFAVMVALMHLHLAGHYYGVPLIRASHLAVDFFFVLSGFVISHAVRNKLNGSFDLVQFAVRRFARVWPLHAVMLSLYVGLELVKWYAQRNGVHSDSPAFAGGSQTDPLAIPANLLLVHALDLFPRATWNVPSWSISAEFYTYLLFALCVRWARERVWLAALLLSSFAGVFLSFHAKNMDVTFDYGFVRCVFGFFAGHLVYRAYVAYPRIPARWATAIELACVVAIGVFMSKAFESRWELLAPLVFVFPIFVFASERGALSRALKGRGFQAIGRWSYAIYLVHQLVWLQTYRVVNMVGKRIGQNLFVERGLSPEGIPWKVVDFGGAWTMDLLTLVLFAVVIALSALAYRLVEQPGQRLLQRVLEPVRAPKPAVAPLRDSFPVSLES